MEEKTENKDVESIASKVKDEAEKVMECMLKEGIQPNNIDFFGKVVDIHKDISNEDYWKIKEEVMKMRYRNAYGRNAYGENEVGNYGEYGAYNNYGEYSDGGNYGRMRDSRGRYMARGYDTKYRGEMSLEDMHDNYRDYSESKELYSRGNYGAKEDTLKSLDYMMKSAVQFIKMLQQDASSHEELELIKKYTKQISEM